MQGKWMKYSISARLIIIGFLVMLLLIPSFMIRSLIRERQDRRDDAISEVSEITGLKQYVLRYWETEFSQLNPSKNRAGNRNYRSPDVDLILNIKLIPISL